MIRELVVTIEMGSDESNDIADGGSDKYNEMMGGKNSGEGVDSDGRDGW